MIIHKEIKLNAAIAITITLVTGCTSVTNEDWQSDQDRRCAQRITKFNYEGHSYLLYQAGGNSHMAVAGITHDANCQCRKQTQHRNSLLPEEKCDSI